MKLRSLFSGLLISFFLQNAFAECDVHGVEDGAPVLCGNAISGGFLYGESDWTDVSSNIPVVEKGGVFVLGLPMEAPKTIKLSFKKDKITKTFSYNIQKREYKKQAIQVDEKFITYPQEVQKRIDAEDARIIAVRSKKDKSFIGFMNFKYPFTEEYPISGTYGLRRIFNGKPKLPHKGFDIAAPFGTPVHSIGQGRVVFTLNSYLAGKMVLVAHGYGIYSAYLHLSKINVKIGDLVSEDSVIGNVGATGRVSGPHLHLGLYFGQEPLDAELVLSKPQNIQPQIQ